MLFGFGRLKMRQNWISGRDAIQVIAARLPRPLHLNYDASSTAVEDGKLDRAADLLRAALIRDDLKARRLGGRVIGSGTWRYGLMLRSDGRAHDPSSSPVELDVEVEGDKLHYAQEPAAHRLVAPDRPLDPVAEVLKTHLASLTQERGAKAESNKAGDTPPLSLDLQPLDPTRYAEISSYIKDRVEKCGKSNSGKLHQDVQRDMGGTFPRDPVWREAYKRIPDGLKGKRGRPRQK